MKRTTSSLRALTVIAIASFAVLLSACGGGASNDGPISEEEAREAANHFGLVTLGMFTGDTDAQEFIDLFAPECTEGVDASAIGFVILFVASFAPELQDIDLEAVDVGDISIEYTDEGALVKPVDENAMRLKVDGEFVTAEQVFGESGFEATGEDAEPLLLVRRDGDIKLGDCAELQEMGEGFSTSTRPAAVPVPGGV